MVDKIDYLALETIIELTALSMIRITFSILILWTCMIFFLHYKGIKLYLKFACVIKTIKM